MEGPGFGGLSKKGRAWNGEEWHQGRVYSQTSWTSWLSGHWLKSGCLLLAWGEKVRNHFTLSRKDGWKSIWLTAHDIKNMLYRKWRREVARIKNCFINGTSHGKSEACQKEWNRDVSWLYRRGKSEWQRWKCKTLGHFGNPVGRVSRWLDRLFIQDRYPVEPGQVVAALMSHDLLE